MKKLMCLITALTLAMSVPNVSNAIYVRDYHVLNIGDPYLVRTDGVYNYYNVSVGDALWESMIYDYFSRNTGDYYNETYSEYDSEYVYISPHSDSWKITTNFGVNVMSEFTTGDGYRAYESSRGLICLEQFSLSPGDVLTFNFGIWEVLDGSGMSLDDSCLRIVWGRYDPETGYFSNSIRSDELWFTDYVETDFDVTVPDWCNSFYVYMETYGTSETEEDCYCTEIEWFEISYKRLVEDLRQDEIVDSIDQGFNGVLTPDSGDQQISNQFGSDVSDKKDESDKLRDEMEKLDKPVFEVDDINPMDKVDENDVQFVGDTFNTIFQSNTLLTFATMALVFALLGYILYGKRG